MYKILWFVIFFITFTLLKGITHNNKTKQNDNSRNLKLKKRKQIFIF